MTVFRGSVSVTACVIEEEEEENFA